MAKFRLVHIGPQRESGWLTVQRGDYFSLRWAQVKDHQAELAAAIEKETMIPGGIGDDYSEWLDWNLLPPWARELLEAEPL